LKKAKKQNIIIAAVAIIIVSAIVGYNYSYEQTKQKGFKFGNELQQIQEEVKQSQIQFDSKITQWREGDLSLEELLDYSETHLNDVQNEILKYDKLNPPNQFTPSVELFKFSTQAQLDSDKELIEWIKTKEESHRIRSDSLLQESFEYEMLALGEFNAVKAGLK